MIKNTYTYSPSFLLALAVMFYGIVCKNQSLGRVPYELVLDWLSLEA